MRPPLLRHGKQVVNITLLIAHMHTAFSLSQALGRVPEILQPADTFLLLNGGVMGFPSLLHTLELFSAPILYCRQSQWQSCAGYHQTLVLINPVGGDDDV